MVFYWFSAQVSVCFTSNLRFISIFLCSNMAEVRFRPPGDLGERKYF